MNDVCQYSIMLFENVNDFKVLGDESDCFAIVIRGLTVRGSRSTGGKVSRVLTDRY